MLQSGLRSLRVGSSLNSALVKESFLKAPPKGGPQWGFISQAVVESRLRPVREKLLFVLNNTHRPMPHCMDFDINLKELEAGFALAYRATTAQFFSPYNAQAYLSDRPFISSRLTSPPLSLFLDYVREAYFYQQGLELPVVTVDEVKAQVSCMRVEKGIVVSNDSNFCSGLLNSQWIWHELKEGMKGKEAELLDEVRGTGSHKLVADVEFTAVHTVTSPPQTEAEQQQPEAAPQTAAESAQAAEAGTSVLGGQGEEDMHGQGVCGGSGEGAVPQRVECTQFWTFEVEICSQDKQLGEWQLRNINDLLHPTLAEGVDSVATNFTV